MHIFTLPTMISAQVLKACLYVFLLAICHASLRRSIPDVFREAVSIKTSHLRWIFILTAIAVGWHVALAILALSNIPEAAPHLMVEFFVLLGFLTALKFVSAAAMNISSQGEDTNLFRASVVFAGFCVFLSFVTLNTLDNLISTAGTLAVLTMVATTYRFNHRLYRFSAKNKLSLRS